MNNVGQTKTFVLNGNPPSQPMRYVWKWWDGSADVTTSGTVAKRLNIGGNPADNFQVKFSCEAVNEAGQSTELNGALVVNNPPGIVLGSTSLTNNGGAFVFRTKASLIAYDFEGDAIGFRWQAGGQDIGAGSRSYAGAVSGTYSGTFCGNYNGTVSSIDYDVASNGSLVCHVYDMAGGTTSVPFYLFGQSPVQRYTAPAAGSYENAIDASAEPVVRIGAGEYAEFTVYTPSNSNPTDFLWTFHGSNGWAATTYSPGVTTPLENRSVRNVAVKATLGETPGSKIASCRVRDTLTGVATDVKVPVVLIQNSAPVLVSTTITPSSPAVNGDIVFEANATDADADLLTYKWYFPDFNRTLYGRKVCMSSKGILAGSAMQAVLTVTDRLGASISQQVNSQTIS